MIPRDSIAASAELDAAGFLPLPGETAAEFQARFAVADRAFAEFDAELRNSGRAPVFDEAEVTASSRIPPEIMAEAAGETRRLYAFENFRVPGFFLSGAVGWLWGGCMIGDPDNGFAVMLLREVFRRRRRWLFYRRDELVAHELCHAMRQSLGEIRLEEYFAYQTSPSALRRYFGNCFIRERDAILFILPTFILLGATIAQLFRWPGLPVWPFWIAVALYPAFLLWRNFRSRRVVRRAEKALRRCGVRRPEPVLFRCTFAELVELGNAQTPEQFVSYAAARAETELRWAIIQYRFIQGELLS